MELFPCVICTSKHRKSAHRLDLVSIICLRLDIYVLDIDYVLPMLWVPYAISKCNILMPSSAEGRSVHSLCKFILSLNPLVFISKVKQNKTKNLQFILRPKTFQNEILCALTKIHYPCVRISDNTALSVAHNLFLTFHAARCSLCNGCVVDEKLG